MSKTHDTTVQLDADQIGQHAMQQAYESSDDNRYILVNDNVEWDLYDAHNHIDDVVTATNDTYHTPSVSEYEGTLDGVEVSATVTGTVTEQVARATRMNPPEYKTHDVEITVTAWWFPRPDQLGPLTAIEADQHTAPLAPPDPEPYYDR